jgi:hypothetical protein
VWNRRLIAARLVDEHVDEALLLQVFLGFAERATLFGGLGERDDLVVPTIAAIANVTATTYRGGHRTYPSFWPGTVAAVTGPISQSTTRQRWRRRAIGFRKWSRPVFGWSLDAGRWPLMGAGR